MPPLQTFIVEDSPVILENLVATLEELSAVKVIGHAEDEPAALAWLSESGQTCDLLIIDIFLKRGSGLGVLHSTANTRKSLKRVVLTNYATADLRQRCQALGADKVFDKSSELEELISYCDVLAESKANEANEANAARNGSSSRLSD